MKFPKSCCICIAPKFRIEFSTVRCLSIYFVNKAVENLTPFIIKKLVVTHHFKEATFKMDFYFYLESIIRNNLNSHSKRPKGHNSH